MKVTVFGTRGSTPISDPRSVRYGGNTTCLRIESECLPHGWALAVDTGTGFVPLSRKLLGEKVMKVGIIYTHYHHDHTQGLFLSPHVFIPSAELKIWGPKEHCVGPEEMLEVLMASPFFPVDYAKVKHHVKTVPLQHIGTQVLVIHPRGGFSLMDIYHYRERLAEGKQLNLGNARYPVEECLVIFMHKTEHPEYTVTYRFEEKPTGRVFVFLTDHENTASLPKELLEHVRGAHLLIQDAQYSHEVYKTHTAGFGHGTPEYCAEVMMEAKVVKLGLTHHDPFATDADVDKRVEEAIKRAERLGVACARERVFGCADYMELEV